MKKTRTLEMEQGDETEHVNYVDLIGLPTKDSLSSSMYVRIHSMSIT